MLRSTPTTAVLLLSTLFAGCDAPRESSSYRSEDAAVDVEALLGDEEAWSQALPKAHEPTIAGAQELLACDPDYFAAVGESCVATDDCKDDTLPDDALPDASCLGDDALARPSCSAGQIGTCTAGGTRACLRETWLPGGICASVTAAACAYACCSGMTAQCYNWN
jgi:hypothetical protein